MIDLRELQRTGQKFAGRYRLRKQLGRGGFSEVWLAHDETSRVDVALKVHVPSGMGLDEEGMSVFREEYARVCSINHTHLLRPQHYDTVNRHPFLELPYCEKGSAARLVGRMDEDQLWQFIRDVASGLAHLHGLRPDPIIHQDIKPDNILLTDSGLYSITDFGISIRLRRTMRRSMRSRRERAECDESGSGTLAYMGPERFGESALPLMASDIWSLGATLYELAAGALPFGEEGGLNQKRGATIPKITRPYTKGLKELIYACLAKETWKRPTAEQIVEACGRRALRGKVRRMKFDKRFLWTLLLVPVCLVAWWNPPFPKPADGPSVQEDTAAIAGFRSLSGKADSILSAQHVRTENGTHIAGVEEVELVRAIHLYDEALALPVPDSLRAACRQSREEAGRLAAAAYRFFSQEEQYSRRIEALERANGFQARRRRLEPYVAEQTSQSVADKKDSIPINSISNNVH